MKNASDNLEHASVRQYCKAVRTPAIGANFVSMAEQAVKENHTHIRYLEALLALECEERDRHAIANRIRDSQLQGLVDNHRRADGVAAIAVVDRSVGGPVAIEGDRAGAG